MTNLERAILAHIFNSKTQPVSLDELVRVTNAERTEVLLAIGELHGKGYLTVTFRMKPYGMAMTYLSCVIKNAGKKKPTQVSCGTVEGHGQTEHCPASQGNLRGVQARSSVSGYSSPTRRNVLSRRRR